MRLESDHHTQDVTRLHGAQPAQRAHFRLESRLLRDPKKAMQRID